MDLFNTYIAPSAAEHVAELFKTNWLSEGKQVSAFEDALSEHLGLCNPVAVNSGTSALHLALSIFNLTPEDEVILPAQTFIATALAVMYTGAKIVFADIDPHTGNISVDSIKDKFTDKTAGVIGVDWAGYPCDIQEIVKFSNEEGIFFIEDAAQALGAIYQGDPVGSHYADATCFSFQATKHLTTGDGGCICSSYTFAPFYRKMRWFGIDKQSNQPDELGERQYTLRLIGYKYHLNDYAATLGLSNLVNFKERLTRRVNNAKAYETHLANVPGLRLMSYKKDRLSAYWAFPMLVERRGDFVRKMRERKIPVSVIHRRIDRHPLFGGIKHDLVGQALFDESQIHIPVHDGLMGDDVWTVIQTIQEGW